MLISLSLSACALPVGVDVRQRCCYSPWEGNFDDYVLGVDCQMDCDEEEACSLLDWAKLLLLGGNHQLPKKRLGGESIWWLYEVKNIAGAR
jgi:hypothetical protein